MSRMDEIRKAAEERGYITREERYEQISLEYGPPRHVVMPDRETINRYRGRLPSSLLRTWSEHGWGCWQRGKVWLCDPAFLQPVVDELLDGDPEFPPDSVIPFAYTAFGSLYLWIKDYTYLDVDPAYDNATVQVETAVIPNVNIPITPDEAFIDIFFSMVTRISIEIWDDEAEEYKDMLPLAIERLGEVGPGEMYGFFPALAMGGAYAVENLRKTPVIEHLIFLFQLQKPMLEQYTPPAPGEPGYGTLTPLRRLGRQKQE